MKTASIFFIFLFSMLQAVTQPPVMEPSSLRKPGIQTISLAGIWKFRLDPFVTGISSNGVQWMPALAEEITLPGSTDQAGKGIAAGCQADALQLKKVCRKRCICTCRRIENGNGRFVV